MEDVEPDVKSKSVEMKDLKPARVNRDGQAGAELCQGHIKLGYPASSFILPFILFLYFKIGT